MSRKRKAETTAAQAAAEVRQERAAHDEAIASSVQGAIEARPVCDHAAELAELREQIAGELADARARAERAEAELAREREQRALTGALMGIEHKSVADADTEYLRAIADAAAMARALEVANEPARARAARRISDRLTVPKLKANGEAHA